MVGSRVFQGAFFALAGMFAVAVTPGVAKWNNLEWGTPLASVQKAYPGGATEDRNRFTLPVTTLKLSTPVVFGGWTWKQVEMDFARGGGLKSVLLWKGPAYETIKPALVSQYGTPSDVNGTTCGFTGCTGTEVFRGNGNTVKLMRLNGDLTVIYEMPATGL